MQKSNLGISIGAVGAAAYLLALFGGYVPLLLLTGYVLLFENNAWLKRITLKSLVILLAFSLITCLVGLIPDLVGIVETFMGAYNEFYYNSVFYSIINAIQSFFAGINSILYLFKTILLLGLSLAALKQSTIIIAPIDKLLDKIME